MSMTNDSDKEPLREMLTAREVLELIPLDRAALFRLESERLFPQGHFVTARKKLWFKNEIVQWQRDLADPDSELSKKLAKAKGE
jgi:prophage regulatory protein